MNTDQKLALYWTVLKDLINWAVNWEVENCQVGKTILELWARRWWYFVSLFLSFFRLVEVLQILWPGKRMCAIGKAWFEVMEVSAAAVLNARSCCRKTVFPFLCQCPAWVCSRWFCTACGLPSCMLITSVTKFNKPNSPHHFPIIRSFTRQQWLLPLLAAVGH